MATESVDEILKNLVHMIHIDQEVKGDYATPSFYMAKAKTVLEAYYTRECARKCGEARTLTAQLFRGYAADEFDALCERVRKDPAFGNSTKGKKDNFLDGAESMLTSIQAYAQRYLETRSDYTDKDRECARKVLEGAEGLWQAISNAPKDSWYGTAHEYIAELHAAIQEVGGGEK